MTPPTGLYIHANTVGAYSVDNPQLTFAAMDNLMISHYEVSIDDGAFQQQVSPYTPSITNSAPAHKVVVRAYDTSGNYQEETLIYPPSCLVNGVSLFEVTPVTPFNTSDTTPDYTFYSSHAGFLGLSGGCSSASAMVVEGLNTITFNELAYGEYDSCQIQVVTNTFQTSNTLKVSSFSVIGFLGVGFVDTSNNYVSAPSVDFSTGFFDFSNNQSITGTLGTADQRLRVNNDTFNPYWNMTIAPVATYTTWSNTTDPTQTLAYNDTTNQTHLTIDPQSATLTNVTNGDTSGLVLGSSATYSDSIESITLLTSNPGPKFSTLDITDIQLTQTIPTGQHA